MSISLKVVGRFALLALLCMYLRLSAQAVWFEPNQGQVHRSVEFLARSGGGYVYFGRNRMAVRDVRMDLIGANRKAEVEFDEPTGGISSYFIGRTEKDWHTGIPHYARVRYRDVYSGIDLIYYNSGRDIEYDFVLRPGADPNQIRVAYNKPVRVDENGDLLVAGLRQKRPKVYQNGREIACDYLVGKRNEVRLALAEYDHSQGLTVDPILDFSTYIGGPGDDDIADIKVDSAGFVYLAGASQSPQAPTLDPFQQSTLVQLAPFVLKFAGDVQHVVYYALVGGNGGWDEADGIVVDSTANPTIVGRTRSTNFPVKNAFQTQFKAVWDNAFITRLTSDGKSLIYSTYFGGTNWEIPTGGAAIDSAGNVWLAGYTESQDFPVKNPLQASLNGLMDCFVAKFSPAGTLLFATYFGGSALDNVFGISVDARDNVYLAGMSTSTDFPVHNALGKTGTPRTGFGSPILFKLSPDGQSVIFSTYLGDSASGGAGGVALDAAANIYVTGDVDDPSFQSTPSALQPASGGHADVFLIKLDSSASKVLYATYLGGSGDDAGYDVRVDGNGYIYLLGRTNSPDFPVKNPLQQFRGGGPLGDLFVAKIAPDGSLVYSTPLGGSSNEMPGRLALAPAGAVYVTGATNSTNFPVQKAYQSNYGGGYDGIFARISDSTPIEPSRLTVSPGILVFRYVQGGAPPPSQVVNVAGGTFVGNTSAQWMGLTTQGTLVSVLVNPAGLGPGTYSGSVILNPATGTPATVAVTLTVLAPAPVLTSIDPTLVTLGSDDKTITLHGSGFTPTSMVLFGGLLWTVTPIQYIDSSTLKFSTPPSQFTVPYNYTIAVQNPQSAVSNVLSLAVGVPAPNFTAASVVNAGSFAGGPVAPGEIVTIFGTDLAGNVTFDNIPATIVYSSATQISATVPYAVRGPRTSLQVGYSIPVSLNVTDAVPAIFTADASGKGQAAALNQDNSVNGASNPAAVGSVVAMYGTGGGTLTTDVLPRLTLPVTATVGGMPAIIYYAGVAPGLVQGAMQVNVLIPDGVTAGPAVPVAIMVGSAAGNTVTLAVR